VTDASGSAMRSAVALAQEKQWADREAMAGARRNGARRMTDDVWVEARLCRCPTKANEPMEMPLNAGPKKYG
jgi:hypothetical protein